MLNFGDGTYCNIEIQLINQGNFIKRFLFYWAKIFSSLLKDGENYETLPRTISIAILDFNLNELQNIPDFYTSWKIIEEKYKKNILTSVFDFRIIELPKLKQLDNKQLNDKCTQWMLFLDNPKSMEVKKIMKSNAGIQKAIDTLEEITSDRELMRVIELRQKAIRDEISFKAYMQKQVDNAKKELEEAKKETENAKKETENAKKETENAKKETKNAKKEGEHNKSIEIAKNLLRNGIDISIIQDSTGLTQKEIENL